MLKARARARGASFSVMLVPTKWWSAEGGGYVSLCPESCPREALASSSAMSEGVDEEYGGAGAQHTEPSDTRHGDAARAPSTFSWTCSQEGALAIQTEPGKHHGAAERRLTSQGGWLCGCDSRH